MSQRKCPLGPVAGRMGDECVAVRQLASVVLGALVAKIPIGAACRFFAYLTLTLVAFPNSLLQNFPGHSLLLRFAPQPGHRSVSSDKIELPPLRSFPRRAACVLSGLNFEGWGNSIS